MALYKHEDLSFGSQYQCKKIDVAMRFYNPRAGSGSGQGQLVGGSLLLAASQSA